MTTLGRYLLLRFLGTFAVFFFLFTSLFILIELFEIKESRSLDAQTLALLGKYLLLRIPFLAYASSPIAALLACIYVVASRAHQSEVIAAQAAGISIFRYSLSIIVATSILAAFLMLGSEYKLPEWSDRADFMRRVEIQKKTPPKSEFLDVAVTMDTMYMLAERFVPDDGLIETATIIVPNDNHSATVAVMRFSRLVAGTAQWKKLGLPEPKIIQLIAGSSGVKLTAEKPLETIALSTLLKEIREFKKLISSATEHRLAQEIKNRNVKVHAKLAFPLSVPFLAVLGAGLGARIGRRRGLGTAVTAALVTSLAYMFMLQTSVKLGQIAARSESLGEFAPVFPWMVPIIIATLSIRWLNPLKG